MNRILDLYDHPPADGRVICVDEFGPLNLQPRPGRGWFPARRPRRLRATYHRDHGVRHLLGALDLATGRIHYRFRDRKRWIESLAFLKTLRARWPREKLYVIADNFSPHKRAEVREWAANNNVELVFLPTYSSWLNWIESEFAALRYFALNGTDHRSHNEQDAAIGAYVARQTLWQGPFLAGVTCEEESDRSWRDRRPCRPRRRIGSCCRSWPVKSLSRRPRGGRRCLNRPGVSGGFIC